MLIHTPLHGVNVSSWHVDWQSSPLPIVTPGRRRIVSRFRSIAGDPTCAPPDFNDAMLAIWEDLWNAMPQEWES